MLVTLLLAGCSSHKPLVVVDPTPPISDFTRSVVKALPTWTSDPLAVYERPELDRVYQDLYDGATEDKLREDWQSLEVLDKALHRRRVL